ncbi:unnamed protein product [Peniophora sp. CBMAI 1063]|nr:unnamed protein product [Peniophora sp. CBMAI 1063]
MSSLVEFGLEREQASDEDDVLLEMPAHLPGFSPNLSRVTLLNCLPPLSSPIFSHSLIYLSLKVSFDQSYGLIPTTEDLLELLFGLRELRELHLALLPVPRSLDGSPLQFQPDGRLCVLPTYFRCLDYSVSDYNDSLLSAIDLISRVSLPRDAEISMLVDQDTSDEGDDTVFFRLINSIFQAVDMQRYPWAIQIDHWDVHIGLCIGSSDIRSEAPANIGHAPVFCVDHSTIKIERNDSNSKSVIHALYSLPLVNLTCLHLCWAAAAIYFPANGSAHEALATARAIRHITIHPPNRSSFFEELCRVYTDDHTTTFTLFPYLDTLTIMGTTSALHTIRGLPDPASSNAMRIQIQTSFSSLGTAMALRQRHATPIHKVYVERLYEELCDWESHDSEELKKVVFFDK